MVAPVTPVAGARGQAGATGYTPPASPGKTVYAPSALPITPATAPINQAQADIAKRQVEDTSAVHYTLKTDPVTGETKLTNPQNMSMSDIHLKNLQDANAVIAGTQSNFKVDPVTGGKTWAGNTNDLMAYTQAHISKSASEAALKAYASAYQGNDATPEGSGVATSITDISDPNQLVKHAVDRIKREFPGITPEQIQQKMAAALPQNTAGKPPIPGAPAAPAVPVPGAPILPPGTPPPAGPVPPPGASPIPPPAGGAPPPAPVPPAGTPPAAPGTIDPTTGLPLTNTGFDLPYTDKGTEAAVTENAAAGLKATTTAASVSTIPTQDQITSSETGQLDAAGLQKQNDAATAKQAADDALALETQRSSLAAIDQANNVAKTENAKAQLDQIFLNHQNDAAYMRRNAQMGGADDLSGLNYVRQEVQHGQDALNYLRSQMANSSQETANKQVAAINKYEIDIKQNEATKMSSMATAYDSYLTKLESIKKDLQSDATTKRELTVGANKDYFSTLNGVFMKHADNLQASRIAMYTRGTEIAKFSITQQHYLQSNALRGLALATRPGVVMSAEALSVLEKNAGLPQGALSIHRGTGGTPGETVAAINAYLVANNYSPQAKADVKNQKYLKEFIIPTYQAGGQKTQQSGPSIPGHETVMTPGSAFTGQEAPAKTQAPSSVERTYADVLAAKHMTKEQYPIDQFLHDTNPLINIR